MYEYRHFITENIAPCGAKSIVVYDSNNTKVCSIPLGRLKPSVGEKLYSFGLISDTHLWKTETTWRGNWKLDNALNHFATEGCSFCVISGDITETGFYMKKNDNDTTETPFVEDDQFALYKGICDKYNIPVYELCGNHESYYGQPITRNLDRLETYTGKGELLYTVTHGNDVFILIGQPKDAWVMSDTDLQLFYETLEENRNKRCFVFIHSHFPFDSGAPLITTNNTIFNTWGATKTDVFKRLMAHYKNTILFHGHTHEMFESQESDKSATYTKKNGFHSFNIPSLGKPKYTDTNGVRTTKNDESQGYIVDVYADFVVLNGIDFIRKNIVPIGTFKIDTTLQTIEANTFTDSTGTITT